MKNVLRPLLAVAALFLMPAATAYAQGKDAEVKQDQVKEAARDAEREGTIVDGATGAADRRRHRHGGRQDGADRRQGPLSRLCRYRAVAGPCRRLRPLDRRGKRRRAADHRARAVAAQGALPHRLRHRRAVSARSGPRRDRKERPECAGHRSQGRSRPHPLSQQAAARRQDRGAKTAHHSRPEGARDQSQEQGHLPDCPRRGVQGRPAGRGASAVGDPDRGRRPVEGPRGPGLDRSLPPGGVGLHLERRRGGRRGGLRRDPVRLRPLPRHRRPCLRQCVRRERRA